MFVCKSAFLVQASAAFHGANSLSVGVGVNGGGRGGGRGDYCSPKCPLFGARCSGNPSDLWGGSRDRAASQVQG